MNRKVSSEYYTNNNLFLSKLENVLLSKNIEDGMAKKGMNDSKAQGIACEWSTVCTSNDQIINAGDLLRFLKIYSHRYEVYSIF